MRAPGAPGVSWMVMLAPRPRSSLAHTARSLVVMRWHACSRRRLRIETGDRVSCVDQVALVDEPLDQYPGVARGDIDLLAAAADAAERRAGGHGGALGHLGRADGAADRRDDDPPVGLVLGLGPAALRGDPLPGAVEGGGAAQREDLDGGAPPLALCQGRPRAPPRARPAPPPAAARGRR